MKPSCLAISLLILAASAIARAENPTEKVCFQNVCLQAEIADTVEERSQGLMFREELVEGRGMLFVFEQEVLPGFWMKNVSFPLDIIWINKDKIIVGVYPNAMPCRDSCESITPPERIKYALEVKAGFIGKNKPRAGDKVDFKE